jgi:hypothetical protein
VDVLIDALRVKVLRRGEPLEGTNIVCPVGGAEGAPRNIAIALDEDPPTTSYGTKPFLFTLKKGEVEAFHILATAELSSCEWIASLYLLVEGKRKIVTIDNQGNPFKTTSTNRCKEFLWAGNRWLARERDN